MSNISVKLLRNQVICLGGGVVKSLFLFFYFSSTGHFVQPSRMISAVLVNGHIRNISMMLF